MRALTAAVLLLGLTAHAQRPSDGDNLETFPTIIDDLTSTVSLSRTSTFSSSQPSTTLFNPSAYPSLPGPAIPPSSYLSALPTASSGSNSNSSRSWSTLVEASHPSGWNTSATQSDDETIVTSTVDGSVATVTVTNTDAPSATEGGNAAARVRGEKTWVGAGVVLAVGLATAGGAGTVW
ncbi:hypothetical protein JCM10207_005949 [Rhodosporidiobolus poonsookiae]